MRTRDDKDVVLDAHPAAPLKLVVHRLAHLARRVDDALVDPVLAIDDDIADRGVLGSLEAEVAEVDGLEVCGAGEGESRAAGGVGREDGRNVEGRDEA